MGISWIHALILVAGLVLGGLLLVAGIRLYMYLAKKEKENKE